MVLKIKELNNCLNKLVLEFNKVQTYVHRYVDYTLDVDYLVDKFPADRFSDMHGNFQKDCQIWMFKRYAEVANQSESRLNETAKKILNEIYNNLAKIDKEFTLTFLPVEKLEHANIGFFDKYNYTYRSKFFELIKAFKTNCLQAHEEEQLVPCLEARFKLYMHPDDEKRQEGIGASGSSREAGASSSGGGVGSSRSWYRPADV